MSGNLLFWNRRCLFRCSTFHCSTFRCSIFRCSTFRCGTLIESNKKYCNNTKQNQKNFELHDIVNSDMWYKWFLLYSKVNIQMVFIFVFCLSVISMYSSRWKGYLVKNIVSSKYFDISSCSRWYWFRNFFSITPLKWFIPLERSE